MGKTYTGYTSKTMEKLILDAGAWFKNFEVGTDTYEKAVTAGKLLGATQDGGKFEAKAEFYTISVDGIKGDAKGMKKIKSWTVILTASILEIDSNTIRLALGAADVDSTTDETYDIITGKSDVDDDDYLDNVTWVGTLSGSDTPVIIQVFNALNTEGMSLEFKDGSQGKLPITFNAHYGTATGEDSSIPPFKIYYPKTKVPGVI